MAVTLPLVFFLCNYLLNDTFDKKNIIAIIPFLFLALLFGVIAILSKTPSGKVSQSPSVSFFENILIVSDLLVFYLSKLGIPTQLSCLYPPVEGSTHSWFYLSAVVIILMGGIILNRYPQKIRWGLLFFFVTLLPVLPIKIVADRYTYIPYIGLFYIVGEGFSWFYDKIKGSKIGKISLLILLIGIIGIFSFLTWERCKVWRDSIRLWSDVLKNYPDMVIAHIDRGTAFLYRREYDRAISDFNQALGMKPSDDKISSIYNNRGNAYAGKGLFDPALSDFNQAITLNPKYDAAYSNRGNAYFAKGLNEKALTDFNKALEINPRYVEAYFNKALVLEEMGRYQEAIEAYQRFIEDAPPQYGKHILHARKRVKELYPRSFK